MRRPAIPLSGDDPVRLGRPLLRRDGGRLRYRVYGLAFVALLLCGCWASYAAYDHQLSDDVPVTVRLATGSGILTSRADVKLRGVVVGQVRDVHVGRKNVVAQVALDRDQAAQIPSDVRARLLPSTLFGERYVDLVGAGRPAGTGVRSDAVIPADTSPGTLRLQRVLADTFGLLRAVRPADLDATLYAVSHALEGRGDALGRNLERVDTYLKRLDPHLPTLEADLRSLRSVSDTYADVTPDLAHVLRNVSATSRTVTAQRVTLQRFFADLTGTARVTRRTLADNEQNLVGLASASRGPLGVFARYAPEYPCLLHGLARYEKPLEKAFAPNALHITLEVAPPRPPYRQHDYPVYGDNRGSRCYRLPHPPVPAPAEPTPLRDGTRGGEVYELPPLDGAGSTRSGGSGLDGLLGPAGTSR